MEVKENLTARTFQGMHQSHVFHHLLESLGQKNKEIGHGQVANNEVCRLWFVLCEDRIMHEEQ
ncbi:hypothetical protein HispidOSU_022056, partial [Sigmodon hispidus]